MTTSSDHRPPPILPNGEHWYELTATLPSESTEAFGSWLVEELETLEQQLEKFVTPLSRQKASRR